MLVSHDIFFYVYIFDLIQIIWKIFKDKHIHKKKNIKNNYK